MKALESMLKQIGRWTAIGVGLVITCGAAAGQSAYVKTQGNEFLIGNEYLQRTVSVESGAPHTTELENKISGRTYAVSGKEFELRLIWERLGYAFGTENPWSLDASSFKVSGQRVEDGADGEKRLVFQLVNRQLSNGDREPALDVELIYEIRPGEAYTRQWMRLKTEGAGQLFVHYADVQTNDWHGSSARLGGFGQPIYSDDLFWGLEYPSGINRFEGGTVSLGSFVGLDGAGERVRNGKGGDGR